VFDDEDANRAEDEAGEDGAPTQHFQPVVEHAYLTQLVHSNGRHVGPERWYLLNARQLQTK